MRLKIFILVQLVMGCTFLSAFWIESTIEDTIINQNSTVNIPLSVNASNLEPGSYTGRLRISDSQNGFIDIPMQLTITAGQINPPENFHIILDGDEIVLSWDAVGSASYYKVMQSTSPDQGFVLIDTTSLNFLRLPLAPQEVKSFYQVISVNTSNPSQTEYAESSIITYLSTDAFDRTFTATDPPLEHVRNIAEFEPMQAVLIRYPFGLPISFIAELSQEITLITLVDNQSQENYVYNYYQSNDVVLSNCQFIQAETNSYWTRDYGPWFISVGNSQIAITNFPYNRPRPDDNDVPIAVANFLGTEIYGMNLTHTGGNYMADGMGIAASSDLVLEENPELTVTEIDQIVADYLGIHTYHTIPDPNNTYIDHIDCWGKFLAPDKIIIRSVPTSHPQYDAIEEVVTYFESQTSSYGRPYQIFRVYTPDDEPYSNSLILNNRVFVPQIYSAYDAAALSVYEQAMPGYDIVGVYGSWLSTDALHCRTHEIPDLEMTEIIHRPPDLSIPSNQQALIEAQINAFDQSGLNPDSLLIYYAINSRNFNSLPLINLAEDLYQGLLPIGTLSDTIFYYIKGISNAGKCSMHPFIGESDCHYFVIGSQANSSLSVTPENITLSLQQYETQNINLAITNNYGNAITITLKLINEGAEYR